MSTGCQEALKASLYEQQQDGKKSEEDPTAHGGTLSDAAARSSPESNNIGDIPVESLLIVWNRTQAKHVKVYTNPHPMGVSSIDFTPDGKLLATLSSLIPENYIMGKAPSQKASECLDTPAKEGTERADYSDTTNRNGSAVPSDIYQGVAIWNWKDSGQVYLSASHS
ncbi:hypothetical protein, conserved [Eimeria maxima]|uniref:Uncharacterized protein n=1 Tax=Eimeria maxima TaxID=5804 RepID=U6M896_EIMMA|nr:hypothetical protein, conserved [Eimeria maxima]CDJ60432.1 hypothetical protein, conserved [Eimeria maxima]